MLVVMTNEPILNGNCRIISYYKTTNTYHIRTTVAKANAIIVAREVRFADMFHVPKEELTTATLDLATNQTNKAHKVFQAISGKGLKVSIKENRMDTSDLDYLQRYYNSGLASPLTTAHASIMATTIAGAGNTSPQAIGVAPKAGITSSDFARLLPDPDGVFQQYGITIQNHSYGTVIQNYYGAEAEAYDKQMNQNPILLHVFSSGNNGNATGTGTYNGIQGVANLTGNFKMSKNSLVVGAVDSFYSVPSLSSRGPAFDGRIKPELVAFGEDGSSGAAAMVSGAALLLQDAYKEKHGVLPSSAVVKAILINSASDVGSKGIDHISGFGNLNTYGALLTIKDDRFIEDVVSSNQTKTFSIRIPANAAQVKISLVWNDPSATVNSTKALVNDLDLSLQSSSGDTWLPWVLHHQADKNLLGMPAERKRDALNNIEQISIENPSEGNYTIIVNAATLQSAAQDFAIAYEIGLEHSFEWSFPVKETQVKAGATNVLRWQTNETGNALIEFTVDNSTWHLISTIPDIRKGYLKWVAPDTISTAKLRLRLPGGNAMSSDTFIISKSLIPQVGFQCSDSFLLYWNQQGVEGYEVYELKGENLQPFRFVKDTFLLLKQKDHPGLFYSIAPLVGGKAGWRSPILNYKAQGVDCYFKSFFLQTQNANAASFVGTLGSVFGIRAISFQKLNNNTFESVQQVKNPHVTQFAFDDNQLTRGLNQYRLQIELDNGQVMYSEVVSLFHFTDQDVIVYPNPAQQNQPVQIITSKAGRKTMQILNSNGVLIRQLLLKELRQQIPPLQLSTGIYFLRILDEEDGSVYTQKLIVY